MLIQTLAAGIFFLNMHRIAISHIQMEVNMQIYLQRDKLYFHGTVRELREFLQSLPAGSLTLREYILGKLH
jgi:hypothetical protein